MFFTNPCGQENKKSHFHKNVSLGLNSRDVWQLANFDTP